MDGIVITIIYHEDMIIRTKRGGNKFTDWVIINFVCALHTGDVNYISVRVITFNVCFTSSLFMTRIV